MNLRPFFRVLIASLLCALPVAAQRDLSAEVEVTAGEEVSNLDRATQRVVSTVAIKLTNRGAAALEGPLHAPVEFTTQGDRSTIRLEGAGVLGGFGQQPYLTPYLNLTAKLPEGGLAPGGELTFTLRFSRPSSLFTTYKIVPHGVMNRSPSAVLDGPAEAPAGVAAAFSGAFSSDPDGDALTLSWDFGDNSTAIGPAPEHTYARPGVYDVTLRVRDAKGLESRATRTILVVPSGQFALGRTRALDDCGIPLAGVTVTEFAPGGAERSFEADADGYAVLGGDEGDYRWRFAKPGHLTVWRTGALSGGRVVLVASPWITPLAEPAVAASPLSDLKLEAPDGSLTLEFPAGAVSQPGMAGLTMLHSQSLPLPLPRGWSPLAAAVVSGPGDLLEAGQLTLTSEPPAGGAVCLLRYDESVPRWVVADLTAPFAVNAYGTWAVVLADAAPTTPPAPVEGETLNGFTGAGEGNVTAAGSLAPPQRTASLEPANVKTRARVEFTTEAPQASGRMFRTRVNETYTLRGGAVIPSPEYDTTIFAYREPGAPASRLAAGFPLRPIRLFGPAELQSAQVRSEVMELTDYQAVVLGAEGGSLAAGALRLALPPGALTSRTVAELRELDAASLARLLGGFTGAGLAFQLGYGGGAELEVAVAGMEAGRHLVLARVISAGGREGLLPVLRLLAGPDGVARSIEPQSGPRLPGLTTGGTYVLVAVDGPQGLVRGQVLGIDAQPRAAMPVTLNAAPWLAASGTGDGRFLLVAKAGAGAALAVDPADGNTGEAQFDMNDVAAGVEITLTLRESGPRVVFMEPADAATGVRTVAPVVVRFSEPLQTTTFGPDALTVSEAGAAAAVSGSLSLSSDGTEAVFLAANPLKAGAAYQIILAATLKDRQGLALEGPREFSFTTLPPENRGEAANLTIFEPGAENVPQAILDQLTGYVPGSTSRQVVIHGSAGTADPRVPVILVNLTTGQTATVLSKTDGSFASFLEADEEDFVEAVFVNAGGNRITIPASRQVFDDGRIGLYRQGGILEASNEAPDPTEPPDVGIEIKPGGVDERIVIGMQPFSAVEAKTALAGQLPEGGVALAGVIATHEVGEADGISEIEFKFDPGEVELPPGITRAEDATFLLTRVQEVDGQIVYEMIDTMAYKDGVLTTKLSPPDGLDAANQRVRLDSGAQRLKNIAEGFYKGLTFGEIVKKQFLKDIFDVLKELKISSAAKMKRPDAILKKLGLPTLRDTVVHQLLLPIMISQGVTTNIGGRVVATRVDADGNSIGELLPVAGALMTIEQPPVQRAGRLRPGQIVTTSNDNGQFMMRMDVGPEGAPYVLSATHPRFPGQRPTENDSIGTLAQRLVGNVVEGGSQGLNVSLARITFIIPNAPGEGGVDEEAPEIRASHSPFLPATGLDTDDPGAVVTLAAFDNVSVAEFLVRVERATGTNGIDLDSRDDFSVTVSEPGEAAPRVERQVVIKSAKAGRIVLGLEAADPSGNRVTASYAVDFARPPLVPNIGGPGAGPRVMSVLPPSGSSGVIAFPEIRLRFSKELPAAAFLPENLGWLTFGEAHRLVSVRPGLDRREVFVRFTGAESGSVSLTIGSPLTSADGKPFDQNPDEEGAQSHVINYTLATPLTETLPAAHGGGVAMLGGVLFTLDRIAPGSTSSKVLVQEIGGDLKPNTLAELTVSGEAVDLAVIPSWSFIERPGAFPRTVPVLAVMTSQFGGGTGDGNLLQGFKTLRFYDVSNPAAPALIGRGNVSFDPLSKIVKIAAVPPFLIYQEQSADVTSLRIVDMASFILGHNATQEERDTFPKDGVVGVDLNADGDFTDAGEIYPSPPTNGRTNFFGDFYSYAPLTSAERLVDFSLGSRGMAGVIATFTSGTPAVFRNILNGSDPADPAVGTFRFAAGQDPKRLSILSDLPVRVDGQPRLMDVAAVSMRAGITGEPSVMLLDLSQPRTPRLLGEFILPPGADGAPQIPNSIVRRGGNELALITSTGMLLLDSNRLLERDASGRTLAILGQVSGLGGGTRSFVADPSGIVAVAASANNKLAFTGPSFDFLTLPGEPEPAATFANRTADALDTLLGSAVAVPLAKAADTKATPPRADDHYYVLARMPGNTAAADGTLRLTLASLSFAGLPGNLVPAPVLPRLIIDAASRPPEPPPAEGQPAPESPFPLEFKARRLSDNRTSPHFNVFLAGPFTLHRTLGNEEARRLGEALPTTFLRIDRSIFTGLAPGTGNGEGTCLDPFRPVFSSGIFTPGPGREALCDYTRNPLIFVPGVMASKLRGDRVADLWLSVPNLLAQLVFDAARAMADAGLLRVEVFGVSVPVPSGPFAAAADYLNALNDLSLGPNGESKPVFATDVLREIFIGADTGSVEKVQGPLLDFLRDELGYREYTYDRNALQNHFALASAGGRPAQESLDTLPDLFPFPYDWRLDSATNAQRLADYIELIKASNPDVKNVDVLAHSMGGLVTRRYMLEHPGGVENFISACSPFLGSPKAANTLKTGDLGELMLNFACGLELGKQIARHMPALHQLMPSQGYFDLGGRPVVERGWDADANGFSFDAYDYAAYRKAMDGSFVYDPFLTPPLPISRYNQPFHSFGPASNNTQDDWRGETGGTRIFHIVAATQKPDTIARLRLMPRLVPVETPENLSLELPPVEFEDSEQIDSSDLLLPAAGKEFPASGRTSRLEYGVEVDRGMGDGTVPLLSQVRGFGSPLSLNAPGTVMLPLVSRDPRQGKDELFSHAGMLKNEEFFELLRGILDGNLPAQPALTLSLPDSATEGSEISFSVSITGGPAGQEPTVLWDTGDGGFAVGPSGKHVWHDDGLYTVTCLVGFPDAPGAVISGQIRIENAAPAVVLTAGGEAAPGQEVRLVAAVDDPGSDDGLSFRWDLGDGTVLEDDAPFTVTHRYDSVGTFTATVTVTDDNGAATTATTPVTITTTPGPAPNIRSPRDGAGFGEQDDAPPVEFANLIIGGHDVLKSRSPRVVHNTRSLSGQLKDFVVDEGTEVLFKLRSVQVAQLSPNAVELRAYRLDPEGTATAPESTAVIMKAAAYRMDIRLQHHVASGLVRCYEWQVATTPGEEVTLNIPWDQLAGSDTNELRALTAPVAFSARPIPCQDTLPPSIEADFDEVDYSVLGLDLALPDGTALRGPRDVNDTRINQRAVFTLEAPPDRELPLANSPGGSNLPTLEGVPVPEGSIATEIEGPVPRGTEPSSVTTLLSTDAAGMMQARKEKVDPSKPALTPALADTIKSAVQQSFVTGAAQPFYRKFVLSNEHVLIFEQGTGAALWKNLDKARDAYTPRVSDNDYELFLPSVVNPASRLSLPLTQQNPSTPEQLAAVERFGNGAFAPEFMEGDWYFLPPKGFERIGTFENEIPLPADPANPTQIADYISRVQFWRYTIPAGNSSLEGKTAGQFVDINKGTKIFSDPAEEKSVFDNPAPPAAVISFVLTENLKRNATLRETLPDVSYFPFRREHFQMAVMSLEKPPPFGDDPVGDAGMGRGLLLLKWVLEGAFLPPFSGNGATFNSGVDDTAIRTVVFNRLRANAARLEPEGLEWGLYQEFAALSEAAHLKVAPCDEDGNPLPLEKRGVFGDFFSAHDKKTVKKVGKAAIRGVLARLATEDNVRPDIFSLDPAAFDADLTLPSFEHLIARLGRRHVNVFGGGEETANLIDDFLAAKIGQPNARLKAILATPASTIRFVRRSFDFLREQVQVPTTDDYEVYVEGLLAPPLDANRVAEHQFRSENASAIDLGFATTGSGFRPGRLALHGIGTPAKLKYKFAISVKNTTEANPVAATVALDAGLGGAPQTVTFSVPAGDKVKFPDPDNAAVRDLDPLAFSRSAADFEPVIGTITLSSSFNPAKESRRKDNVVFFEHERIPLGVYQRERSGSLELALERVENPAAPTGDCFLTLRLRELTPTGGTGQVLPTATFSFYDSNGVEHPIPGGRLLLNRGTAAEPIAWPIVVIAATGGNPVDGTMLDARLNDVFFHGDSRRMTEGQSNFGLLIRNLLIGSNGRPANPEGPRTVASALAPSVFGPFQLIASASTGTAVFTQCQTLENLIFAFNEDRVVELLTGQRRSVLDIVSEDQDGGLSMASIVRGQPQTQPIAVILESVNWNPGRNGKQGDPAFSNGQVFVHQDLLDRALRGEQIEFFLRGQGLALLPAHEPLKVELFHELVFRLLSAAVRRTPSFNVEVDRELVRIFPGFQNTYSGFFGQ